MGEGLIPSPKAVGLECVSPSSTPFLLSLQIPCSLVVAKLICNSCVPYPPPTRLREIEKRALGCCHAGPMLLCWGEWKVQNTGEPRADFFLDVVLFFFQHFFSSNFKPPPPPLTWSLLFLWTLGWLALQLLCPPPPQIPHTPTWEPYQSTKRTTRKFKTNS